MQRDFENFFYCAQDHYLQAPEMLEFKHHLAKMGQRLDTYKCLRDREIPLFQAIADRLVEIYPQETNQRLERALKHWMAVMRYGAMAMVLNNPDYFAHRLLEWLTDIVDAHDLKAIEQHIYELLLENLADIFSAEQFHLIKPFLYQAQATLLMQKTSPEAAMVGEST